MKERVCPECGAAFMPRYGTQVCCGDKCRARRKHRASAESAAQFRERARKAAAAKRKEKARRRAELVVDDTLAATSSHYYDRSTTAIPSSDLSYNTENAKELWEASEKLCDLK